MANANIGIVAPVVKGAYSDSVAYDRLNIVHGSDGATYQAIQAVPAGTALSNTTYWMQITPKAPTITAEDVANDYGDDHDDLVTNTGSAMAPNYHYKIPRGVTGNESIDDTKGDGDTDYVWSADKCYGEVTDLKSQTIQFKGTILANNTDLDTIKENSEYLLSNTSTYTHNPLDGVVAYLITFKIYTNWYVQYCSRANSEHIIYFRYFSGNTWNSWIEVYKTTEYLNLKNNTVKSLGTLSNNTDLDTVLDNSIYLLPSDFTFTNKPNSQTLILVTNKITNNYYIQFCYQWSNASVLYYRKYSNNTWEDWILVYDKDTALQNKGQLQNTDDTNDVKNNSIMSASASNTVSNWPMEGRPGSLITTKLFGGSIYQQMTFPYYFDIATISANSRKKCGIFTRYYQSSWTDWNFIKLTPRNYTGKYYAFGDSTSWGYSSDHSHEQSPWNYPQMVGDLIGVDVHNLSDPAQGLIKNWDTPTMDGDTVKDFAIIPTIEQMVSNGDFDNTVLITVGWAYNDTSYYGSLNFGSPTDAVPSSTTGITTYLGYYAKILDILQAAAPMATVILITGFGSTSNTAGHKADNQFTNTNTFADGTKTVKERYDAMEEMANYNGYFCINQAKGTCINKINANTIIGDNIHPTYDGYRIYGNFIASRIASLFQNV